MHKKEIKPIYGHQQEISSFLDAQTKGKLHHAWMISGPKGIGKATLSLCLVHNILGGNKTKIENLSHPDFLLIESENEDGSNSDIKVDQIREIGNFLSLTPIESNHKVVMIDSIDYLNKNSSNALLKLLEEPPLNSILILICHSIGLILPTIRSRCRILKLNTLPIVDFNKAMEEFGDFREEELIQLYDISSGSIGIAKLFTKADHLELYNNISSMVDGSLSNSEINKIATKAADNWELIKFTILHIIRNNIKNLAEQNNPNILSKVKHFEHLNSLLSSAEDFYLDKGSIILSNFIHK
jgi:DNA polymerase-3 subunit delta'